MAGAGNSRQDVTAESVRMVADAVDGALLDLAEALRTERPDAAPASAAPERPPRVVPRTPAAGAAARTLTGAGTRAVAEAAAAIAAAIVPAVVERIDVNALIGRVDVEAVVARVPVDEIVARIDLNRVLATVDVDELVGRVDIAAVAREALEGIDIGEIVQESTAGIATDTMEAVRVQAMNADDLLARIVDRLLGRHGPRHVALERRAP